jgi:hypothetical protein
MKEKISVPIYEEREIDEVIPQLQMLWETCKKIKKYYPSVWVAITEQYDLDYWRDKKINDELFIKKLEILLLQDEELRRK